jgi:hypothetical protein
MAVRGSTGSDSKTGQKRYRIVSGDETDPGNLSGGRKTERAFLFFASTFWKRVILFYNKQQYVLRYFPQPLLKSIV